MANFKIVISDPKSKKAFQKEIEQKASGFMGKKVGEKVKGDGLGLSGYEFQMTGGSDAQGFPMRRDMDGIARKKVLLSRGTGFRTTVRGKRKRKSVRGNTVSSAISQINVKIVTYGSKPVEELIGKTEKKEKLTKEQEAEKLKKELSGMVEEKAPEKSRSDQIREEMEAQEKTKKEGAKPAEEEKESKKEGPEKEEAKPADKAESKEEPPEEKAEGKEETVKETGKPSKKEDKK